MVGIVAWGRRGLERLPAGLAMASLFGLPMTEAGVLGRGMGKWGIGDVSERQ